LFFAIYNKSWSDFWQGWSQAAKYLSGWHVFMALKAFIESEWADGTSMFLTSDFVLNILR